MTITAESAVCRWLPRRITPLLLLLLGCLLGCWCASPASAFVYPARTVATGCTWFTSRFCTNVMWPVPISAVTSGDYDRRVQDDIVAWTEYTGSRTCRRWYTDFRCRSAFPYCDAAAGGWMPCLKECQALANHCPALRLDCSSFSNSGCKTRQELGLIEGLTPNDPVFNMNSAPVGESGAMQLLLYVATALAAALLATW